MNCESHDYLDNVLAGRSGYDTAVDRLSVEGQAADARLLAVRILHVDDKLGVAQDAGHRIFLQRRRDAGVNLQTVGLMPRIYCVMVIQFHAAVPVSHEFLPSPGLAASLPATI